MSKQTEITIEEKRIFFFLFKKIVVRKDSSILLLYILKYFFPRLFCFSVVFSDVFTTLTKPRNRH